MMEFSYMESLVILVTIIVVICIIYLKYVSRSNDLAEVYSTFDNRKYLVRNVADKEQGANSLATLRQKLEEIVSYMGSKFPDDERIKRLVKNFRPDNISEGLPDTKYTSYTVNKGEKIVFCIRQRDEKNNLVDINTLTFVGIHELAHLMTKSVGKHNTEFWDNMKFLLQSILDSNLNIYEYKAYHKNPQEYCGTKITDTPVKK